MTAANAATDLKTLRVGVISPNLAYGLDWLPDSDHADGVWPLESVAKKVALLFDRIYLTHDLDVTCEIVGSYEENAETATLIETCKMNHVDPQAWLADVLARLPDHPASKLAELLSWTWKTTQQPNTAAAA